MQFYISSLCPVQRSQSICVYKNQGKLNAFPIINAGILIENYDKHNQVLLTSFAPGCVYYAAVLNESVLLINKNPSSLRG